MKSERVFLIDSGMVFGSPHPMFLMTPQRAVDIFLSFETSDRGSDDNPPFKVFDNRHMTSLVERFFFSNFDQVQKHDKY